MRKIAKSQGIVYNKGVYRKVSTGEVLRPGEKYIDHLPYGVVWCGKRGVRMFYQSA